jgi:hypothetical protein
MTKVVFRYDKKADEILAVFPEFVCRICGCVMTYAHIGQHGEADKEYIMKDTKPATEEQYRALYNELVAIGYNDLHILKRVRLCP